MSSRRKGVIDVAILEISIVPLGLPASGISEFVACCLDELEKYSEKVRYELTAMGTIIEGDLDVMLDIVRKMHEAPFRKGAKRVLTTLRLDDRRDINASIEQKIRSVQEKIQRTD